MTRKFKSGDRVITNPNPWASYFLTYGVDNVGTIILSTKEHNTPNETIYKVYEALGYTLVD